MESTLVPEDTASATCLEAQLSLLSVSTTSPSGSGHGWKVSATASAAEIAPRQFTLFPILPTEIRLKIWNYVLLHDRIIEIRSSNNPENYGIEPRIQPWLAVLSLLRVCHESRAEAQKINWREHTTPFWHSRAQVVKFDTDRIYLDFITCIRLRDNRHSLTGTEWLVNHLVLPSRLFDDHPHDYARAMFELFKFVDDVTVVMVEGPRTSANAELITLKQAAERNYVAASLIGSAEVQSLEARLEKIKEWLRKKNRCESVPTFRIMALDRTDGTNMANSFISFRI